MSNLNGIIVIWTGDTRSSNKVYSGDIAVKLKGKNKFLGLYGKGFTKGEVFYESDKEFEELNHQSEKELYIKMN